MKTQHRTWKQSKTQSLIILTLFLFFCWHPDCMHNHYSNALKTPTTVSLYIQCETRTKCELCLIAVDSDNVFLKIVKLTVSWPMHYSLSIHVLLFQWFNFSN